jgi:hypothetical protein
MTAMLAGERDALAEPASHCTPCIDAQVVE